MNLKAYPKFGSGTGLHRVAWLLRALDIDLDWLARASIAITGSNGKGSTAAFSAAIGQAHGFRTGCFTSPHLYDVRERFRIDAELISGKALSEAERRVNAAVRGFEQSHPGEKFGVFEILFVIAIDWFFQSGCDLCILEAGIGGRFDPVRVSGARHAVLASLDLEHRDLLGKTLEEICFDKSDICAPGGRIFYGPNCRTLRNRIESYCRLRGVTADFSSPERLSEAGLPPLEISLRGAHQAENAALAISVFQSWLRTECKREFSWTAARQSLAQLHWPGRLELIGENPLTITDVGHSPDAIATAIVGLTEAFPEKHWIVVFGVSADKPVDAILEVLLEHFDTIVCTRAYHRGAPAEEIQRRIEHMASSRGIKKEVVLALTIEAAASFAEHEAKLRSCGVYVTGATFVVAEYSFVVRGGNPQELEFL